MHFCTVIPIVNHKVSEEEMKANYNKLWKLLIDKKMNKTMLQEKVGMSPNTLAKMSKDENVSMDVLIRICDVLKCDIGDIMEVIPDEKENGESNG